MQRRIVLLSLVLIFAPPLCAQARPHELMLLAGAARNSEVDELGLVLGGGYRWVFSPKLKAGPSIEWTNADSVRIWTFTGDASWRITKRVLLIGGVGFEMVNATDSRAADEEENNFFLRLGGGMELLRGKRWTLTPRATIDFSNNGSSTIGVAAEIGFGS